MGKLNELRQKLGELTDRLITDEVIKDADLYAKVEAEIADVKGQIERFQRAQEQQAALARPAVNRGAEAPAEEVRAAAEADSEVTLNTLVSRSREVGRSQGRAADYDDCLSIARRSLTMPPVGKRFKSLGENLQAIQRYYVSRGADLDPRLVRAPTGAGEFDPSAGGFLVQVDFAASIFMLAHGTGNILSRVNSIPISPNANGLKIPGVDETSRQTGSRWGGVQSNWVSDGTAGTESRPKFRLIEFDLKKLISKMTLTDELLADTTALTSIASQAFAEEIVFMTEDAIVEGSGSGQPLGYLNSTAKVTVPKETGQAPATIVKENLDKMWSRVWARSRQNAVWIYNQDIEPQLFALNGAVGTGGQLVFLPPGGLSGAPFATLYGRPAFATEYNSTLGTENDIACVDFSQYTLVDKGGVQMASSLHVAFDTDETRLRITYRVDGMPMWAAPLTPFKGSATKSPFVTLATR